MLFLLKNYIRHVEEKLNKSSLYRRGKCPRCNTPMSEGFINGLKIAENKSKGIKSEYFCNTCKLRFSRSDLSQKKYKSDEMSNEANVFVWGVQLFLILIYIIFVCGFSVFFTYEVFCFASTIFSGEQSLLHGGPMPRQFFLELLERFVIWFSVLLSVLDISFLVFYFNFRPTFTMFHSTFLPDNNLVPKIENILFGQHSNERNKNEVEIIKKRLFYEKYKIRRKFTETYMYIKHILIAVCLIILMEIFIKIFTVKHVSDIKWPFSLLVFCVFGGTSLILFVLYKWDQKLALIGETNNREIEQLFLFDQEKQK